MMRAGFLLALLFLAGCQTYNPVRDAELLRQKSSCCENFSELPYRKLVVEQRLDISLDENSPVFDFDSGRYFFQAFELPEWQGPLQVTFVAGTFGSAGRVGVVRPVIRMLDAQFKQTRQLGPDDARHWQGSRFDFTVFINSEDSAERYMVVAPAPAGERVGRKGLGYAPVQVGHGVLVMPVTVGANQQRLEYRSAATGSLNMHIRPYGWKSAGTD